MMATGTGMLTTARPMPSLVQDRRWLTISRALGKVVVTVHGALDAERVRTLHRVLVDLVDNQGNLDVVVDLRDLHDHRATRTALDAALDDVAARAEDRSGLLQVSDTGGCRR